MSKSAKLAVSMNDKERIWGFLYLLFELFVLPILLDGLNSLLPAPLSAGWLNFLYFSLNFIFVVYLFRSFLRRSLIQTGKDMGKFLWVTALSFGVYYVCNLLLGIVIRLLAPDFANLNDGSIAMQIDSNATLMVIGTAIFVPIAEELLHRGLVFGCLYKKNPVAAYLFSAILFSAIHIMGYAGVYSLPHLAIAFVQYLPAGWILAWAYRKSGSIFSPILIHAMVNILALYSV